MNGVSDGIVGTFSEDQLEPLPGRVFARLAVGEKKTPGGILLPDKRNDPHPRPSRVIAVAVGTGEPNADGSVPTVPIKVGDTLLVPMYGGIEVERPGTSSLWAYKIDEVLARLDPA